MSPYFAYDKDQPYGVRLTGDLTNVAGDESIVKALAYLMKGANDSVDTSYGPSGTPSAVIRDIMDYFGIGLNKADEKGIKGAFDENGVYSEEQMERTKAATQALGEEMKEGTDKVKEASGKAQEAAKSFVSAGEATGNVADSLQEIPEAMSGVATAIQNAIITINKAAAAAGKEKGKAWGGRIGSAGHFLVGEDGPEYIIPVTKPQRAMDLINQALSEMGMGALNRASGDFGIGSSASFGTLGGSLDSLINGLGGNTNISAPINIYVTATGADGEEIGAAAYNAAERHLVKTLRGVCA